MFAQDKHLQNYSKFDAMSTQALEEILQLDATLPDNETLDPDAILYILEVLARRENETGAAPDVEAAWHKFNEKYRPYISDTKSLYEDNDASGDMLFTEQFNNSQNTPAATIHQPRRNMIQTVLRTSFAAIIAVVILVAGTATASAFGYDIWDALAKWTGEVFGFQRADTIAPPLQELQYTMEMHGVVTENVLPSYLPDGYEVVGTQSWGEPEYIKFDCLLSNGESSIILNYCLHLTTDFSGEFEKNMTEPALYKAGGVTHYLMDNVDTYLAAWQNGRMECSIVGINSKDDLIKIIDSIYGEIK